MKSPPKMICILLFAALLAACAPSEAGPGSVPEGWSVYSDAAHGFSFAYPPEGQISDRQDGYARIGGLPIAPGTTLVEKYLEVNVSPEAHPCPSPTVNVETAGSAQETALGGLTFLRQSGGGVATGNIYEWAAYSTQSDGLCASLTFVLHYTDPANYVNPPPVFDRAAEEELFAEILATFQWTKP